MVAEIPILVAVISAIGGATFSTLQGYANRTEGQGYSLRKLLGGLIASSFASFGVINLIQVPETLSSVGFVGLIIANLLLGFGADKIASSTKKE